ncbi:outer membrane beta-barrel protein [Flavobacterium zepuense]|uniref:Outer membrane beta-barrel protein n=1 Tax=Flavobacterium zepuense TaxID=2593302 RepID=A0A552V5T2_9FLAO|nr:outer membrane beta-barrel protein [Flavobacterium zepuense]TRW25834.1 outer membrane beta-barrel protein [Flavobacterium zepuense]
MKLYTILLALCLQFGYAQTTDSIAKPVDKFAFNTFLKVYYTFPGASGDNVLSKGNEGKYGFGFEMNLISYRKFYLAGSYEFSGYDVTNAALAGNIEHTNVNNYYARLLYQIPIDNRRFAVSPLITGGAVMIHQKTAGKSYGKQRGAAFSVGTDIDFKLTEALGLFGRARYGFLYPDVTANAKDEKFFSNLNQLNFSLGLKVGID